MRKAALAAAVVVFVTGALVVALFFAPERPVGVDEPPPAGASTLRVGTFEGADRLHETSGSVRLMRDAEGLLLRFEDYAATDGPDVFFYVARAGYDGDPESGAVKVPLDGTKDGQATKRGTFNQRLPADVRAEDAGAVVVWCDRFNVRFGSADLAPS